MRGEKFSFPDFFSNNPILATICVLFLVADIVLLDHIVTDRIHQNDISRYEQGIKELGVISQQMNDGYNKLNEMCNLVNRMNKELELRNHEIQAKIDSQMSSLTSDLKICQETNVSFISKIKEQDSEIASLSNSLHDREGKLAELEMLFAQQIALEPTWIKAGGVVGVFNGDVSVTIDESSDKEQCQNGAAAVAHLRSGSNKGDLCLQLDRPQSFTYKGKKLFLHLLGVRRYEQSHEYLISIVKEH